MKKKYMTDAHLSGLAKELKAKGIDCETVHRRMRGNEDSSVKISDPEIVKFLSGNEDSSVKISDPEIVKFLSGKKGLTLITLDSELAEYCAQLHIPCIRVQDIVASYIDLSL